MEEYRRGAQQREAELRETVERGEAAAAAEGTREVQDPAVQEPEVVQRGWVCSLQ